MFERGGALLRRSAVAIRRKQQGAGPNSILIYHPRPPADLLAARPGSRAAISVSLGRSDLEVAGGGFVPFSEQPALQPVEVDIDDRRRIEREHLR